MFTRIIQTQYGFTIGEPEGKVGKAIAHAYEATIMQLSMYEYFKMLAETYPSFKLIEYTIFFSYALDEVDVKKLQKKLNQVK